MARIIWTKSALNDLKEIGEFIALDSSNYAKITVSKLFTKANILQNFPRLGRVVPEVDKDDIRELIDGNYRIIYEIYEDTISILTVHHSSKNLEL